ncbi:MAG: PQQ-binding-like beta-propeller repeat protein, partial [Acidimicrobiales bacterium]
MTSVTLGRVVATLGACGALAVGMAAPAGAGTTWPTYHGDPSRSGVATGEPALTPTTLAWSNPLDRSAVYGQPVIADGRVFVADENDQVYALDGHDGHVLWSTSVGVPLGNVVHNAGCGSIDPLGITSTPVLDLTSNLVYVVAEVSSGGATPVHHQLVGLSMSDGSQVVSTSADPALPA